MISGANIIYVNNPTAVAANGQQGQNINQNQVDNSSSSTIPSSMAAESSSLPDNISSNVGEIENNQVQNDNQDIVYNNQTDNTNKNDNKITQSSNSNTPSGKININTADKTRLMDIPGVGEVTAGKIIDYRNTYGSFKSVDELINISGIGEKKLENMRPYVTV